MIQTDHIGQINLIIDVETEVVQTEKDEPNVINSIKAIIKHDKKVNLHRETDPPIYARMECNLEPLSLSTYFHIEGTASKNLVSHLTPESHL